MNVPVLLNHILGVQNKVMGGAELAAVTNAMEGRLSEGSSVVDLGCGGGQFMVEFAERYPKTRFLGIDNDPSLIEKCRKKIAMHRLDNVTVEHCDLENDDLDKYLGDADAIYSRYALQHMDYRTVVEKVFRSMKSGAVLVGIEEANPLNIEDLRDALYRRYVAKVYDICMRYGSEYYMSSILPQLFREKDFDDVKVDFVLHSRDDSGEEAFRSMIISQAVFYHKIAPDIMSLEFVEELDAHLQFIEELASDGSLGFSKKSAVIRGFRR